MSRTLMIQGTSSSVGKSILVTALCRILRQDGLRVAPFKAQNMSLNSFVTEEGEEMGRAQVVQAEAAGLKPIVDMNPVLLKPETDRRCQVIVHGRVSRTISADNYYRHTPSLLKAVASSLRRLDSTYNTIIIEGAGSPAEINLRDREIANMRVARLTKAPVLLVGDIDRGGVFASLIGTMTLLEETERHYVKGFIINKFRGDPGLLRPGLEFLEKQTGKPVLGIIPYFKNIQIAQEDSVYLDDRRENQPSADLDIAVIHLPHISNYDDFDPLEEDGCRVRYITHPAELGKPHLIILPGTKSTISDLTYLRRSGLAEEISRQAGENTPVIGICGGYQMLGRSILDSSGVESAEEEALGLRLLDVATDFVPEKLTSQVRTKILADRGLLAGMKGQELVGYEIHMGQTSGGKETSAFQVLETVRGAADSYDGTLNHQGTVLGTYLHGLFHNFGFRQSLLANLRRHWGLPMRKTGVPASTEQQYDRLAELVRRNLNMAAVYEIMEKGIK
ncbi:MAG: cobyric acid synthase [Dehalococcoidales bacterium]|nr:cobyric acid synthase [Dehalococcoidales bacterium]MDP6577479.1 cobyric acid synthase [Dehalococcoidales bacterium]MDP6825014.1 cobyric acid synthase [Dehalococcoidales bacterium]